MGKLLDLASRVKKINEKSIDKTILNSFSVNQRVVTNLITDQLYQGKDVKGDVFPDYSERSVQVFGKRPGPWQGYSSGDLYKGVFADAKRFPIVFGSHSLHEPLFAEALESRGINPSDTYGLSKENLKDFSRSYILPELQGYVRDILHV